jgi:natural product precursor
MRVLTIKISEMKQLEKLKLNQIAKNDLEQREMVHLRGGYEGTIVCLCACVGASDASNTLNSNSDNNIIDEYDQSIHHCVCYHYE